MRIQKGSNESVSWLEAVSNTWVSGTVYYFTGSDWGNAYSVLGGDAAADAMLNPWRGYWIWLYDAYAAYSLIIPKP